MDPDIWSSLPLDILPFIISACGEETALDAWCTATACSSTIYPISLSIRYAVLIVSAGDFITPPAAYPRLTAQAVTDDNDPEDEGSDSETQPSRRTITARHYKHNALSKHGLVNRLLVFSLAGVAPVHYIRHLTLDLRKEAFPGRYLAEPSTQVLEYTLTKLLPHLRSLQSLVIDGPVYNLLLERLAQFLTAKASPHFSRLTVRKNLVGVGYYTDEDAFDPTDDQPAVSDGSLGHLSGKLPLQLDVLTPLCDRLKVLEINEFRDGNEAIALAKLVEGSKMLQNLAVRVCWEDKTREASLFFPRGPMHELLRAEHENLARDRREDHAVFDSACLLSRLPPSLKRLELEDCLFLGNKSPIISPPSFSHDDLSSVSPSSLTTLTLSLDIPQAATQVLAYFPSTHLEHLTLQAGYTNDALTNASFTDLSFASYLCKEIITPNLSTLQTITLTNIWTPQPLNLIPLLTSHLSPHGFTFTDLILGTLPSPTEALNPAASWSNPSLQTILRGGVPKEAASRWAGYISRLRIEAVGERDSLDQFDISHLSDPSLANLRILILQPVRLPLGDHFPLALGEFEEGRLAMRMLEYAPPKLRYVGIGDDRFWITGDGDEDGNGGEKGIEGKRKVVHFKHALLGGGYNAAEVREKRRLRVRRWMRPVDEIFVDPDSEMNAERKWRVVGENTDYQTFVRWNFIVGRSEEGGSREL